MPTRSLIESLAYVNWTVLLSLALGSFAVVAGARLFTGATRGYLAFTASCAGVLGLLCLLTDLALPDPTGLAIGAAPGSDQARRAALGTFVILAFAYVAIIARGGRSPQVAAAALLAGIATALIAGLGWAGGLPDGVPFVIQLLLLAAATGGGLAALILGHWYLVTPRLSERPLVLTARLLTAVVAVQLFLFVGWTATGLGTGMTPFQPLVGDSALLVWLRLIVGLLFPLVLSAMAVRTARTRSMESATGLLYIDVAAIASGTIVAAGLYYASGLLV